VIASAPLRRDAAAALRHVPAARIAAGIAVLVLGTLLPQPLRAVVVVPALLLVPGYALVTALRLGGRDGYVTLPLSFAASVATIPLVVVALDAANVPLSTLTLVPAVAVVSAALAAAGGVRRHVRAPRVGDAGGLVAAAAVAVACVGVVAAGVAFLPGSPPERFSTISLAGAWADTGRPVAVTPGEPVAVRIAVANHTGRDRAYVVAPQLAGGRWPARHITVPAGETWTGDVAGTVPAGGCLHRLRMRLRGERAPQPSPGLVVWFQSVPELPASCRAVEERA
jgi:uncharacterized membrane protein